MTSSSAIACLFVVTLFVGNAVLGRWARPGPNVARLASWWIVGLLVLLIVLRIEGLPLSSIGIRAPGIGSVGWGALLFLVAFMAAGATARIVMPALGLQQDASRAAAIATAPVPLVLAVAATAAVVEELVCRGFLMSRLLPISPVLALLASIGVFTLPHGFGWRIEQLVFVAPLGLIFSLFFLWRPDLPAVIIAHFLVDAVGFLMMRMKH